MHRRFKRVFTALLVLSVCLGFLKNTSLVFAGSTTALVFTDDFNNLDLGAFNGQNQWLRAIQGGADWIIQTGTSGQQLRQNIVGGAFYETPITQTHVMVQDSRVKVDFQATGADGSPQIWLRRSGVRSDAKGYDFLYFGGIFDLDYLNGSNTPALLATGANPNLVTGNWYTIEFEAINDGSGNPVLQAWVYDQGASRPGTPYLTFTDTNKYVPAAGYAGLGSLSTPINYDNFNLYSGDATLPAGAPTGLSGTTGDGQVSLTWTAPVSDGGAAITDYLVEYRTGTDAFQAFSHVAATTPARVVTGLTHGASYDFKVSAVNSVGTGMAATTTTSTTSHNIAITSPAREVSGASDVATLAISRDECSSTFRIPYIQTSTTLAVASTVSGGLPSGGGVRFVLTKGSTQIVQYDMSAPFTTSFTSLVKGEYTLDTYIVDASQVIQTGVANHDQATHIGIGDIYIAIGDSITEGYDGTAYNVDPYPNWLNVPVKSTDNRNYPQCGASSGFYQDHWQEVSQHIALNNTLTSVFDYPVFILNEGFAGITTPGYLTRTSLTSWQNRINTLVPNKWLVNLGVNDGGGSSGYQTDMQSLITTLETSYAATGPGIVLAVPTIRTNWQPYITNLISNNSLTAGPDFNTFFANHISDVPSLYGVIHPTVPGDIQMARLWGVALIYPKNVLVTQNAGTVTVNWDNLATIEPSIAGYKVKYGTTSGSYSTTVDVGNVLTKAITGLTEGQPYYFVVSAYDNDIYSINQTQNSSEVSITPDMTVPVTTDTTDSSWHTTDVTITLTCSDGSGSGCAHTYYTTDGTTPTTSSTEGTSVVFSTSGTYTLKYFSVDTANNQEVVKTASNTVKLDKTAPVISAVNTSGITTATAIISWTTDEDSSSKVDYGLDTSYSLHTAEIDTSPGVSTHSVSLTGLQACTLYNYRVRSKDTLLNESIGSNAMFTTTACATPTPSPSSSNQSTNSSSSNSSPATCDAVLPNSIPDLFEMRTNNTTATLYFTPPSDAYSSFSVEYGTQPDALEFGVTYDQNYSSGVLKYTISYLRPNTLYFFKIKANNGCASGAWGARMSAHTTKNSVQTQISYKGNSLTLVSSLVKKSANNLSVKKKAVVARDMLQQVTVTPTPEPEVIPPTSPKLPTGKRFCIFKWCF